MNSRERVLCAINHQQPDRTPLTIDMQKEVQDDLLAHFNITTRKELWDKLNIDTWLVGADVADPDPDATVPEGESKNPWGYRTRSVSYGKGSYNEMVHFPLGGESFTKEDIDAHPLPDPEKVSFAPIKKARTEHPERAIITHITHGSFFNATFMRGLEQLLIDMYISEETTEYLFQKVTAFLQRSVERLIAEAGDDFDIFYLADDYCDATRPLFSPDLFGKLVVPYLSMLADMLHAADKKFMLHVCGSVRELLPQIIGAGVDMLEPIQTSATGMEVEGLKKDFGDDIAFYGSIDLVKVLNRCTVEEVRAEVRKNISVLGNSGGFILGPGHTYIQMDAPIENILAMYEEALNA